MGKSKKKIVSLDDKEKSASIKLKKLEALEKQKYIDIWENKRLENSEINQRLNKIMILNSLLTSYKIDDDRTIIGSEPVLKSVLCDEEECIVKDKIFELINQL